MYSDNPTTTVSAIVSPAFAIVVTVRLICPSPGAVCRVIRAGHGMTRNVCRLGNQSGGDAYQKNFGLFGVCFRIVTASGDPLPHRLLRLCNNPQYNRPHLRTM
jgi:hypothetical protein